MQRNFKGILWEEMKGDQLDLGPSQSNQQVMLAWASELLCLTPKVDKNLDCLGLSLPCSQTIGMLRKQWGCTRAHPKQAAYHTKRLVHWRGCGHGTRCVQVLEHQAKALIFLLVSLWTKLKSAPGCEIKDCLNPWYRQFVQRTTCVQGPLANR